MNAATDASSHSIRNRLLRLTADSPDLLAIIKQEGRVRAIPTSSRSLPRRTTTSSPCVRSSMNIKTAPTPLRIALNKLQNLNTIRIIKDKP